jgi:hypothetical protein
MLRCLEAISSAACPHRYNMPAPAGLGLMVALVMLIAGGLSGQKTTANGVHGGVNGLERDLREKERADEVSFLVGQLCRWNAEFLVAEPGKNANFQMMNRLRKSVHGGGLVPGEHG